MKIQPKVCLVGLGPHAKRIYFPVVKRYLVCIIELDSVSFSTIKYLNNNGLNLKIPTFFIPNDSRDRLSSKVISQIQEFISKNQVSHLIISTDPKVHKCYIQIGLKLGLKVLVDKPVVAVKYPATRRGYSNIFIDDYKELLDLDRSLRIPHLKLRPKLMVMCQRRFHLGYQFIKFLCEEFVSMTQIPITSLNIYHSDGRWIMPKEWEVESHPYKYGHGKLVHSGYHFIDIGLWLLEANQKIKTPSKKPDFVDVFASGVFVQDVVSLYSPKLIKNLFNINNSEKISNLELSQTIDKDFGETDLHCTLGFRRWMENKGVRKVQTITHLTLDLLHSGFSRRKTVFPCQDMYKGAGRVRHERINLQIGHLLNIQLHSYQAMEVNKDPNFDRIKYSDFEPGGDQHFEIYVFRNPSILLSKGCLPMKRFHLSELQDLVEKFGDIRIIVKDFLQGKLDSRVYSKKIDEQLTHTNQGQNERARLVALEEFLFQQNTEFKSDLQDHFLTTQMMASIYESICAQYEEGQPKVIRVTIPSHDNKL